MNDNTSIYDLDAEAAVLSAVLIAPYCLDELPFLKAAHFYSEAHRRIYEAILHLHEAHEPIDNVTVMTRLKFTERLEQAGGPQYLTQVVDYAPAVAHVATYGRTVWDCWRVRSLRRLLAEHTARASVPGADVQEVLDGLEDAIRGLAHNETESDFIPFQTIAAKLIAEWQQPKPTTNRIATGYGLLDAKLRGGLKPGSVTILAARTGEGKTTLALNMAWHAAKEHRDQHVVFVCLEMEHDELGARVLASSAGIDANKAEARQLEPADWSRLMNVLNEIHGTHMSICHTSTMSVAQLRGKLRRLRNEAERSNQSLGLVVIDYLQLLTPTKGFKGRSREQEVAEMSRDMKRLATELKIPILCLAQLNRQAEGDDVTPMPKHLRESGAIEQDADNILFLSRAMAAQAEVADIRADKNMVGLVIAKQRNGPKGVLFLRFQPEHTRFDGVDLSTMGYAVDEDDA